MSIKDKAKAARNVNKGSNHSSGWNPVRVRKNTTPQVQLYHIHGHHRTTPSKGTDETMELTESVKCAICNETYKTTSG